MKKRYVLSAAERLRRLKLKKGPYDLVTGREVWSSGNIFLAWRFVDEWETDCRELRS